MNGQRNATEHGPSAGTVLADRYRIGPLLGAGGMSRVFACEDLKLPGKRWAVKLLDRISDDFAEAELLSRLRHPALPDIVDAFDWPGGKALVLELIEGETLAERFERSGRSISEETAVDWARQIADCLVYLHSLKPEPIVYRDLKPSNIMLEPGGRIRLIDFGIARTHKPGAAQDTVRMGTIGFAAPEQLEGRQTGPPADVYALGALLHYLLSGGKCPDLRRQGPSLLRSRVDAELCGIVEAMIEPREERRPLTAELASQFALWLGRRVPEPAAASTGRFDGGGLIPAARPEVSAGALLSGQARRLIVVGGWRRSAGATFVAISLARTLDEAGYSCAVTEWPTAVPYLADWLDGGRTGRSRQRGAAGRTRWLPSPPESRAAADLEARISRLRQTGCAVTLVDIGSDGWLSPETQLLFALADGIVVVADTGIGLWRAQPPEALAALRRKEEAGLPVWWIANRDVRAPGREDWIDSFPQPPVCRIPAVPDEVVTPANWEGIPVADREPWGREVRESLSPLVRLWTGGQPASRSVTGFGGLWRKRKGVKSNG
ncbi:serine/threonine-protein kinase [Paenibacillus thermoaerophilus]|uniref:non-specific serine/threonine protein kinase n=1 Tax=Paenibacillus thermoaerophilus TaxID=1215385 RepID=A0ABW2V5G6_9BACL|nr:serine/threonine-protein kinase [Paenibacillus thermoaerophilus]TMV17142.1 serine/threonine protein kinase [Paenibacillus thermoaerophilus]